MRTVNTKTTLRNYLLSLSILILSFANGAWAQSWQSALVQVNADGSLSYAVDSLGNRIPDFSYAGYRNSNEPIPDISVVTTLQPIVGDNTSHIQSAIAALSAMPVDSNGFRGAVLLEAGEYEIQGTVRVNVDGVVLRGVGDGSDPANNTILRAVGNVPDQRDVLVAGGGGQTLWADSIAGSRQYITTDTVRVSERSFEVADASGFTVGDNIILYHPCTESWLESIDYGGTFSDDPNATAADIPWEVDSQPIVYNRYIEAIDGNRITLDVPVYSTLIRSLSPSYIYIYRKLFVRKNIGVEDLRIDIETAGGEDEAHAWSGIYVVGVEDAWVRNCTILHFGLSGVYTNTATRITVQNCRALDPVSLIEGGRRYNFNAYNASQQVLFEGCHASNGRHHYMSNGTSWTSGIVFLDCTSEGAYAASEGHRRWSQALLYDNFRELDGPRSGFNRRRIGLYNRGYFGTSHGWSAIHSVAWNCDVNGAEIHVQKPPGGQNYAIGCQGTVTGDRPPCSFSVPAGHIEGSNLSDLNPGSLFKAQLLARNGQLVGIDDLAEYDESVINSAQLSQNYPNPFNPQTQIRIRLNKKAAVSLSIYDLRGALVEELLKSRLSSGEHTIIWQPEDVVSGIYFYSLRVNNRAPITKKMVYLR